MAALLDKIETEGTRGAPFLGLKPKSGKFSWLEQLMNSSLGKLCIANLHFIDNDGILNSISNILLKYLQICDKAGELKRE